MEAFFESYSGLALYIVIFGTLIATGFGLPLSEDFLLMVIGFLIYSQRMQPVAGILVAFFGCLGSDIIMFNIGYHYGEAVRKHRFILRIMSHGRQEKILQKFRRYGDKFIIFARFVAGLRAPTFLTAGISRMKPHRFITLDGLASLVSVPLFVSLGYLFGDHLAEFEADLSQVRKMITLVVIAAIGVFVVTRYLNLFWQGADDEAPPSGE